MPRDYIFGLYLPRIPNIFKEHIYKSIPHDLYKANNYCISLISNFLGCIYTKDLYSRVVQSLLVEELKISRAISCLIYSNDIVGQKSLCRIIAENYIKIRWISINRNNNNLKKDFFNKIDRGSIRRKANNHLDYIAFHQLCAESHSNIIYILPYNVTNNGVTQLKNDDICGSINIISVCTMIIFISESFCIIYEKNMINVNCSLCQIIYDLYSKMVCLSHLARNTKRGEAK